MRRMRTDRVFHVQLIQGGHHESMLGWRGESMLVTITLAIEGDRRERKQHVIEDQDNMGPWMSKDKPLAMMEGLGVVRRQTGAMWDRAVHQDRYVPGETMLGQRVQRLRKLPGWRLRECLSCRESALRMMLETRTALRCVASRQAGGFFEGMFPAHDQQKKQRTDAHRCETWANRETTRDPDMQGVSMHGASPLSPIRRVRRHVLYLSVGDVSTTPCQRHHGCSQRHVTVQIVKT
jgi:hypothetical protein